MNDMVSGSQRSPYRLYARMMPIVGVAALIASFAESDRRGLLFKSSDTAFFAEDAALAVPSGGATIFLAADSTGFGALRQRAVAPRRGGRTVTPSGAGPTEAPSGTGAAASRLIELPAGASEAVVRPSAATLPTSGSTVPNQSSPGPGFPESPIGLIAVNTPNPGPGNPDPDNPGPVVPAVPEPASWLLMILGVGWLGLSLRQRNATVLSRLPTEQAVA